MKLHIHFDFEKTRIDEIVEGADADTVVAEVRDRVAKRAGFLIGSLVKAMSPLAFAQEATRRYSALTKETIPAPESCDAFVRMAVEKKFATLLEG